MMLFLAGSAQAAPPAVELGSGFDSVRRHQYVRITFGPSDSGESAVIPNFCASWQALFFPAEGASASVYGVNTPGQAAATGTLIKNFTPSATETGLISISPPLLKVVVVNPPASGVAEVQAMCAQTAAHLRPWPTTDSPPPCIAAIRGAAYYDLSLQTLCVCVDDGSPAWEAVDRAIADSPSALSCG